MKDLKNKVVLITGASEGIGFAIASEFAKEGSIVVLLARNEEKLKNAVQKITSAGGKAGYVSCDATNPDDLRKAISKTESDHGTIDILINNAGGGTFKPLHLMDNKEAELPIMIPVLAATVAAHAVAPSMIQRKSGHIVDLTSPAGYFPLPFMLPYTAARHAITGFSLGLRDELRHYNIGVSLICPAQVDTGYFERNDADLGWYPRISKVFPVLKPEQVARKVVKSVKKNKREVIFPFILWFFVRYFQTFPRSTEIMLKVLGLYQPVNKIKQPG